MELLLLSALTGIALLAVLMFWRARRAPAPPAGDADLSAAPREVPSALEQQVLARLAGDGARLERLLDLVRQQHPDLPREGLLAQLQAQMNENAS